MTQAKFPGVLCVHTIRTDPLTLTPTPLAPLGRLPPSERFPPSDESHPAGELHHGRAEPTSPSHSPPQIAPLPNRPPLRRWGARRMDGVR